MATAETQSEARPFADLSGFRRDLLALIERRDGPKGLALKDALDDLYDAEIHHSRLYQNLNALVEAGLVEKSEQDRRTNAYALTERGQARVDAHRDWITGADDDG